MPQIILIMTVENVIEPLFRYLCTGVVGNLVKCLRGWPLWNSWDHTIHTLETLVMCP